MPLIPASPEVMQTAHRPAHSGSNPKNNLWFKWRDFIIIIVEKYKVLYIIDLGLDILYSCTQYSMLIFFIIGRGN